VKEITTDEPAWKGLTTLEVNRLRSAAEQLLHLQRRKNQHPLRNYAIFLLLLRTGLRESELLALELEQYDGSSLRDVQRKGKSVSRRVPVAREACEAIDRYIGEVRGREPGPLFQTRSGEPLAPQHVDRLVAQIAAQANSTLPRSEQIHLTPHVLRHTALRAAAEKKGIPYAMRLAGHTSSRYIWRYAQPSDDELDEAVEEMF
jgi:integrase/recombinase XerD